MDIDDICHQVKQRGGGLCCLLLRQQEKYLFMKSLLHKGTENGPLFTTHTHTHTHTHTKVCMGKGVKQKKY